MKFVWQISYTLRMVLVWVFISKLKTWIQPKTQFKYAHWMKILSLRQNYFKNWLTKTALAAKHATNFLKFCSPPINTNKETRIQGLAWMHSSMSRIFNTDHKFHPSQNRQTESAWTCLHPRNTAHPSFLLEIKLLRVASVDWKKQNKNSFTYYLAGS